MLSYISLLSERGSNEIVGRIKKVFLRGKTFLTLKTAEALAVQRYIARRKSHEGVLCNNRDRPGY
nr:MAG TPA: hypothetical protein [Caudoviricetes sp.]